MKCKIYHSLPVLCPLVANFERTICGLDIYPLVPLYRLFTACPCSIVSGHYLLLGEEEFRKFAIKHQGLGSNIVDQYINTIQSTTVPNIQDMTTYVIEERPGNFRAIDVFTRLISDRIIFMGMPLEMLEQIMAKFTILLLVVICQKI